MWRRRQGSDGTPKGALRRLFAWRVDPEPSARVPLAASPDALLRRARDTAQRGGRAKPWRVCTVGGAVGRTRSGPGTAPTAVPRSSRNTNTGSFSAIPGERGGETTSILTTDQPESYEEPSPDYAAADTLPPGTALLIVLRGPNAGSRFLLDHDFTSAGRHPDSDIFLDDVTVSRRHAEFYRHGDRFTVRDVGSLNGTYVNREPDRGGRVVRGRRGTDRQVPAAVHGPQSRGRPAPGPWSAGLRMTGGHQPRSSERCPGQGQC